MLPDDNDPEAGKAAFANVLMSGIIFLIALLTLWSYR